MRSTRSRPRAGSSGQTGTTDFAAGLTTRVIERLLDAAEVERGMRVLDAASGPGYVAAACAERGADVVGVDVTAEMVSLARRSARGSSSGRRTPSNSRSWTARSTPSLPTSSSSTSAGPSRRQQGSPVCSEPGAKLALSTWDVPERARLLGCSSRQWPKPVGSPRPMSARAAIFRFADEGEFARLVDGVGLRDVEVRTIAFTHRSSSSEELWNGLIGGTVRTRALVLAQPEEHASAHSCRVRSPRSSVCRRRRSRDTRVRQTRLRSEAGRHGPRSTGTNATRSPRPGAGVRRAGCSG